jgi:hypothetical protein
VHGPSTCNCVVSSIDCDGHRLLNFCAWESTAPFVLKPTSNTIKESAGNQRFQHAIRLPCGSRLASNLQ